MSGGQDWASEQISTTGDDMSDKQSCHSQVSDNELVLVRWQDEQDGGWREGVVCVVVNKAPFGDTHVITNDIVWEIKNWQSWLASHSTIGRISIAVVYDRHRHERAIVPLAKVQIVEAACQTCEGDGFTMWYPQYLGTVMQRRPCSVCNGSGKRAHD